MKILITGIAGFIGSHLAEYFLRRNEEVIGLDNIPPNGNFNLKDSLSNPKFRYFQDTILNEGLVAELISGSDMVYHLAAAVGVKNVIDDVLNVIRVNVMGTEIVLKCANRYNKRVLFTSTSEIYGKNPKVPFSENDDTILGPTTVDRWVYSSSKALGEYICLGYNKGGLPISIVRFFNAYGPRLDPEGSGRVISRFLKQILENKEITIIGDGAQTRSFSYIDDVIEGIVLAGERKEAIGEIFNIGTEVETSMNELVEMLSEITKKKLKVKHIKYEEIYGKGFEDIARRVPDIAKAKKTLGFDPKVSLREGLKKTLIWFEKVNKAKA